MGHHARVSEFDGGRVAAHVSRRVLGNFEKLTELRNVAAEGKEPIAEAARSAGCGFGVSANVNRDAALANRVRAALHVGERNVFAVVARDAISPKHAHRFDVFVSALAAVRKVRSYSFGFFFEPADTGAENRAAARKGVEARERLRVNQRVVLGQDHHRGAEHEVCGLRCREGVPNDRVGDRRVGDRHAAIGGVRVVGFVLFGHHHMFDGPD